MKKHNETWSEYLANRNATKNEKTFNVTFRRNADGEFEIEAEETQRELLDAIHEISTELSKIDDARDQIKKIIDATADAFDMPKPLIRKVARLYHKKAAAQFEIEAEDIVLDVCRYGYNSSYIQATCQ